MSSGRKWEKKKKEKQHATLKKATPARRHRRPCPAVPGGHPPRHAGSCARSTGTHTCAQREGGRTRVVCQRQARQHKPVSKKRRPNSEPSVTWPRPSRVNYMVQARTAPKDRGNSTSDRSPKLLQKLYTQGSGETKHTKHTVDNNTRALAVHLSAA